MDIALELSKLDPGETSVALTLNNGTALAFVMLCGRTAVANENVAREEVAASLRTSRLNASPRVFWNSCALTPVSGSNDPRPAHYQLRRTGGRRP